MKNDGEIKLERVKRTDPRLLADMAIHYSEPKGFVGRNICYVVIHDGRHYGGIVAGSSTLHLSGRDKFFGITKEHKKTALRSIVNNIFYHVTGPYPLRNFTIKVLEQFRKRARKDWEEKYGDPVIGFESLVELPRTGEVYRRDGWTEVGTTAGYTCKRTAGKGTDSWSGKRIWDTKNLRPKRVFCRLSTSTESIPATSTSVVTVVRSYPYQSQAKEDSR
jgi:Domain of unknown function (DUF4338)